MAVLCGAAHAACLKNYGAMPLDNEFCHENAVRILIAKVIGTCSPFNLAATPIYTLSHRHYVKIIFELAKSADLAVEAVKKIGFVSYCPACCWREAARLPRNFTCPSCKHQLLPAGPLYIGRLWNEMLLEKMLSLNAERKYRREKEIDKLLRTQIAESKIEAYAYYDLHVLSKKMKKPIKSMDDALDALRKAGFAAERTHFCPTAIRTGAPHGEVLKMVIG
jgi:tRNA (guanine26-N2/guanine27-N2)-dimethyltransferase